MELVQKGFKQTEVGMIPVDWRIESVGNVFEFSGGSQPPRSTFIFKSKKGYLRLLQIRDYKSENHLTFIPENLAQKKCEADDIMIGRYGPPIFQILKGLEGAYNVALIKAIPKGIDKAFAYHFLKQNVLFEFVEKLSQRSSGQTGVDLVQLRGYLFPLPPTQTEQQAIATALSDVDAFISSLDELISKKKAIKQGAMQQLLTPPSKGGKRLPGFDGEWEETVLGELCKNISSGTSNTNSVPGAFPLYGSTGQIGTKNYMDYDGERILVARVGANAGTLYKVRGQYCVSDNTLMISLSESLNLEFLFYSLKQFNLSQLIFGSGQPLITGGQLKNLKFFIPKFEEQKAIAEILSDMDAELEQLEAKKGKYQQIKQGMMQELLTGKTRLV